MVDGAALSAAAIAGLVVLDMFALPYANPHAVLGLAVAYAAFTRGLRGGLTAGLLGAGFLLLRVSEGGMTTPLGTRIAVTSLAFIAFALIGGAARRRYRALLIKASEARRQAEIAQRRSRDLLDSVSGVIWEADPEKHVVSFVAGIGLERLGYPESEWLGSNAIWRKLVHPADYDELMRTCRESARRGEDHETEFRVVTAGGETRWIREMIRVITNDAGRPIRLHGLMLDVTQHYMMEHAVRESESRLRRFIDNAGDALFVHDVRGNIIDVNQATCDSLGYRRDELLRMRVQDISLHHTDEQMLGYWTSMREGEAITLADQHQRQDGTSFPVEVRISLLEQQPPLVIALARDVTQRAQLELQLRQSQKMQAIGRLAGGVAHDFNNLLTAIKGHADLLLQELPEEGAGHGDLQEILKASERAAGLTRQLLAFTRQQVFKPEVLDLNAVVNDMERMLSRLIGEQIDLVTRPGDIGLVRGDRGQLEQVLLNLVVNARDAMPAGGRLTIETANETVTPDAAAVYAFFRPGEYVVLSVTDTGVGMDADTMTRVFEPFFTTKEQGQGTGLGLSTAYGIVKQSDGFIFVESAPGAGTAFRVLLPRTDSSQRVAEVVSEAAATRQLSGAETVLVAEDEEAVRALVCRVLRKQGYTVLSATDGEDALRVATESEHEPDLLVSDIVMPKLGGPELARQLLARLPALRVILMSGYTDDAIVLHGDLDPEIAFLGKPFAPDELAQKVREVLDA